MALVSTFGGLAACGNDGGRVSSVVVETTGAAEPASSTGNTAPVADAPMSNAELARASVLLYPTYQDEKCWGGSGTVISEDGLILTNFHVVAPDESCPWDELVVATTEETDLAPEPAYQADVVTFDESLDLAVIKIARTLDGEPVTEPIGIQPIPIGDSESIEVGDELRILGYPGIGGETVTFTQGSVSGFTTEPGVGSRAWIKTDATTAGGNSGGTAIDQQGRLVGVPTQAGTGAGAPLTDCRRIEDTNGDGAVDDLDSCVPLGGFLNGLRPINLAKALIAGADGAEPVDLTAEILATTVPEPAVEASASNVTLGIDGAPAVSGLQAVPSGTGSVCVNFDYEGFPEGATYNGYWKVNGELSEVQSVINGTWALEPAGSAYFCSTEGVLLDDGVHEFALSVGAGDDERFLVTESFFVGGDHPPLVLTVDNQMDREVCTVQAVPTGTEWWGPDRIPEFRIPAGTSNTVALVAGEIDLRVADCEDNDMSVSTEVLEGDATLTLAP